MQSQNAKAAAAHKPATDRKYGAWVLLGVLAGITVFTLHQFFWRPVISNFDIVETELRPDGLLISGYMHKERDCPLIDRIFYIADDDRRARAKHILTVRYLDEDGDTPSGHAPGIQPWGPWLLQTSGGVRAGAVMLKVTHACNPFIFKQEIHTLFSARLLDGR